jgi:O-antigen ligase
VAVAIQAAGLAATQSATAVGSLAAAGLLAGIAHPRLARVLVPALLVLVALLAGIVVLRRERLLDPAAAQGSWRLRAGNAAAAARMIGEHPLRGVGPGAFAEVYPSVLRPGGNEARHAHCLPLELMAELRIPLGLLATAAFIARSWGRSCAAGAGGASRWAWPPSPSRTPPTSPRSSPRCSAWPRSCAAPSSPSESRHLAGPGPWAVSP